MLIAGPVKGGCMCMYAPYDHDPRCQSQRDSPGTTLPFFTYGLGATCVGTGDAFIYSSNSPCFVWKRPPKPNPCPFSLPLHPTFPPLLPPGHLPSFAFIPISTGPSRLNERCSLYRLLFSLAIMNSRRSDARSNRRWDAR